MKRMFKTKVEAAEWLEKNSKLNFCTNPMLDRGTVFHCHTEGENAVLDGTTGWWAMAYSQEIDRKEAGKVIGKIGISMVPGTLEYSFCILGSDNQPRMWMGNG